MVNQNNHIVARCQWNTSFDDKEKGIELQNIISHWSEHHMPREINAVFNNICPTGQTLKIKALEIDLEIINYDNLKEYLAIQLRRQLQLQLSDIIMYPNKHGQSIEILKEGNSHIHVLRYFLLQGIMPWNYQEIKGTIHQIFEDQLSTNKQEVLHMIKTVGKEAYVRRRISWQFKESNIKKIIENIEKSNHNYIIDFSEEFIKIQERETIVKSGIQDFKKNLWFWILNYLFVDRGTMFNKIDFVRNNIQQMANHFNLEYNELFALIEDAVDKIHVDSYVKSNFILTLSILSERQATTVKTKFSSEKQLEKHWSLLTHFLKSSKNRTTTAQKLRLGDLIHSLSVVSPTRFKKVVKSLANDIFIWMSISKDIEESALKILFSTLSPTKSKKVFNQVTSIQKLALHKQFNIDESWILGKSFQFLKEHTTKIYSGKLFLAYLLKEISVSKRISKTKVLERIVDTEVLSSQKNIETISLFKELKQLYTTEFEATLPKFTEKRLVTILAKLTASPLTLATTIVENYYKTIRLWFKQQPIIVWNILIDDKNKRGSQKLIPIIFNTTKISKVLLEKVYPKNYQLVKEITVIIDNVNSEELVIYKTLKNIKKHLFIESVKVISNHKKLNLKSFLEALFENLKEVVSTTSNFEQSVEYIVTSLKNKSQVDLNFSKENFVSFSFKTNKKTSINNILKLIEVSKYNQNKVAEIVEKLVRQKKIKTHDFTKNERIISNYLLVDGYRIQKEFINIYTKKRNSFSKKYSSSVIENKIKENYWQCIADYGSYRGDKTKFKELFKIAISYYFEEKVVKNRSSKQELKVKNIPQKNTSKRLLYGVSTEELLVYLKEAIQENKTAIIIDGKSISVKKLFFLGLEEAPQEIRVLIKEVSNTTIAKSIATVISFHQFIALITKDKLSSSLNLIAKSIESLYVIVLKIGGNKLAEKIEGMFWKYSIRCIQADQITTKNLAELTDVVLEELIQVSAIDALSIVNEIKDKNIAIPTVLKDLLITKNTTFELLEAMVLKKETPKELKRCFEKKMLPVLCNALLVESKIPSWYLYTTSITKKELIHEVLEAYPLQILSVLRKSKLTENQLIKLIDLLDVAPFFTVLEKLYPRENTQFIWIKKLHKTVASVSLKGISSVTIQHILLEKVLKSWIHSNWKLIDPSSIWKELLWEISAKRNIAKKSFFKAFDVVKDQLPIPLQITYESLAIKKDKDLKRTKTQPIMSTENNTVLDIGVAVPNAGLVLLNSYFLMLLERLNLISNKQFVSDEASINAVHYLQYLVTGMSQTEESLLVLNKVLCGIAPHQPIKEGIEISTEDKNLIDGLLGAAINYWSAIGKTSINGFRGNWLVRNGVLTEQEDRWNLTVEKRPYDILMVKSPFSFSIIKLPWMEKPLHVTWSY